MSQPDKTTWSADDDADDEAELADRPAADSVLPIGIVGVSWLFRVLLHIRLCTVCNTMCTYVLTHIYNFFLFEEGELGYFLVHLATKRSDDPR